jgi:hypothetical protein
MDPYLEHPARWRGVHSLLIGSIARLLQPLVVPRGYFVDIESRVWLETPETAVYLDLAVVKESPRAAEVPGVAVIEADEPVRLAFLDPEVEEPYLVIVEQASRRVVTGIEVISPSNKRSGHPARRQYIARRREVRRNGVSLVEIDLLRAGKWLVKAPASSARSRAGTPDSYVVNVRRARESGFEFDPISIQSRLPRLRVPLKTGEPDVVLDLRAALDDAYVVGAYGSRIDYREDPLPPLNPASHAWANDLLVQAGLRPSPS